MNLKFYIDHKVNCKKEATIYCYIRGIDNISKIQLNTGFKIPVIHWNNEKQEVRKSFNNYDIINNSLIKLKNDLFAAFAEISSDGKIHSVKELTDYFKQIINPKFETVDHTFMSVFDLYLEYKRDNGQTQAAIKFTSLKNHLIAFQKLEKIKLDFDKFNMFIFDKMVKYFLNTAKYTNNTLHKTILHIKSFLNWATERGYNTKMDYKRMNFKESKTEVIYLTQQELDSIINLDLSLNLRLSKARDVFLLACFTGVRYSDISKLTKENIINDIWHLRTEKTKDILYIPLMDLAKDILKKYFDLDMQLPVITNQKSNVYIKEICQLAGIDTLTSKYRYRGSEKIDLSEPKYKLISNHTSRRTFIVLSLEKGMRPEVVMSIVGHKDYKTMLKYVKITDNVKKNEMFAAWNKPKVIEKDKAAKAK